MPTAATAVASATVPLPEVARHDYRVLATIGRGHVGTVFLVTPRCHLRHRQQPVVVPPLPFFFAMKVSKKTTKKKSAEKEILSLIKEHEHSFLPSLRGAFESQKREFLIMDYCPGGDLHSLRLGQPDSRFSSAAILFYGAEVLAALEYLHSLGIVYRDLKPENILLKESGHVVLTDFDLSLQLQQPEQLITSNNGPRQDPPATEKHNKTRFWPKWKVFSSFHRCIPIKSNNDGDGDSDTRNPNPNPISYPNCNPNPNPYYNPKPNPNANPNSNQNYNPSPNPNPNPNAYSNPSPNSNPNPNPNPNPSPNSNSNPNPNASPNPDPNSREGKKHEEVKAMATSGNEYSFVGTEEYMAPEILRGDKQGYTVDWWAFGILLYELAYGVTPFRGHSRDETFHNIMKKEPYLPGSPSLLKDLIQRLLVKDPGGRLGSEGGATALKRHSFFRDVRWDELEFVCRPPFLPPPFSLQELKDRTQQRRRIPVVAHHSTPQIQKSWSASLSSSSSSSFSSSSSSSSASFSSSSTSFSLSQSP